MQNFELRIYDLVRQCAEKRMKEVAKKAKETQEADLRALSSYLDGSTEFVNLPTHLRKFIQNTIIAKEKEI